MEGQMKGQMEVNFNNLRKQAIYSYEKLVEKLNSHILKDEQPQYAKPNDAMRDVDVNGYVLIDANDIQEHMDDLRSLIGAIAMTFEPKSEEFKDVFTEIYPKEGQSMPCFNEEVEV